MIKRVLVNICVTWFLMLSQASAIAGDLLFNVSATGTPANVSITLCLNGKGSLSCQNYDVSALRLSIFTTAANHTYPFAGIRINTPGFTPHDCTPISNGYCLFSVSNAAPASIFISKNSGYAIGGTISGLMGSGLVLQNNGGDNLTVSSSSTSFQFSTPVPFEGSYNVTVQQQPTGLTCTVNNGSGTNVMDNVRSISITCSVDTFTIGGTISNLTANGLVLQNNGGDNLTVSSGSTSFQFSTPVASGGSYNVTVQQQPTGLTCTVSNGSDTNIMDNVTNISITCSVDTFTIGGTISNLTANGLVLQNNGGDNLTVSSGSTSFQFSTPVAIGGSYNVTVQQQPTGLPCTVSNGSGTNVMDNVTNITITCINSTFQFIDISSTGAFIVNGDDNTATVTLSSGHPISLFGSFYSQLLVSTNGFITSNLTNDHACCLPSPLPTNRISGDVLIPLWSDLFLGGTSSGIYYQYFNICPRSSGVVVNEGCHVFEWYNVGYCCSTSPSFNFEVIVYDQSNLATYQYGAGNPNSYPTVTGDQNTTKTLYYQVSPSIIPDNSVFCLNTQTGQFF